MRRTLASVVAMSLASLYGGMNSELGRIMSIENAQYRYPESDPALLKTGNLNRHFNNNAHRPNHGKMHSFAPPARPPMKKGYTRQRNFW